MQITARRAASVLAALTIAAIGAASASAITSHSNDYTYGCATVSASPFTQDGATLTASFTVNTTPCSVSLTATANGGTVDSKSATYSSPGTYQLSVTITCGPSNQVKLNIAGGGSLERGASCTAPPPPTTTTTATTTTTTETTPTTTEVIVKAPAPTATTTTTTTTTVERPPAAAVPTLASASEDALRQSLAAGDPPPIAALAARSAALNLLYGLDA